MFSNLKLYSIASMTLLFAAALVTAIPAQTPPVANSGISHDLGATIAATESLLNDIGL